MEMDEMTKNKLKEVVNTLETSKGELRLFACSWRDDLKRWDIIVSASWVSYEHTKEDIGAIFEAFKSKFNGEFALRFFGIHPLEVKEPLVNQITTLFPSSTEVVELNEVPIGSTRMDKLVIFVSRGA